MKLPLEHLKVVYFIVGPTAVGKTDVAVNLAQRLGTSIISADSRQCYKEMTIGTAKPATETLNQVKHYFIDEFPVTQPITAAGFENLALQYLDEIFMTSTSVVVCGGTGLYIKALIEGLDEMPANDDTIVINTEEEYKTKGLEWLQLAVKQEDPGFYETAEIQNPARLLRALAFVRSTGTSINEYRTKTVKQRPFRTIIAGLELPREALYERINHRVDLMMNQGLLNEVQGLLPYRHLKTLQTVGYTELFDYFEARCSLEDAVGKIKQHSRNYAKRQLTWFKKDKNISWFRADDTDVVEKILAVIHNTG